MSLAVAFTKDTAAHRQWVLIHEQASIGVRTVLALRNQCMLAAEHDLAVLDDTELGMAPGIVGMRPRHATCKCYV